MHATQLIKFATVRNSDLLLGHMHYVVYVIYDLCYSLFVQSSTTVHVHTAPLYMYSFTNRRCGHATAYMYTESLVG